MLADGRNPAWGPGGQRFVFTRDVRVDGDRSSASDLELFTARVDGTGVRRLTRGGGSRADWSSRGQIAFTRLSLGYRPDVYLCNPKGGRLVRVTRGGISDQPSWSPDGRRLAIVTFGPGNATRIVIVDRRGKRLRTVTRGATPAWSPDGQQIAFSRGATLYTVSLKTGRVRRVLSPGTIDHVSWQPLKGG